MMKMVGTAVALTAWALAAPAGAQNGAKNNAAIKTAHTVNDGGARHGANSFTEGQARAHVEHAGFHAVSGLAKGNDGIWRGTALRHGRRVRVALDFKGNVSTAR